MPVYLDMAATAPVLPNVANVVMTYMLEEYGNPGTDRTSTVTERRRRSNSPASVSAPLSVLSLRRSSSPAGLPRATTSPSSV